MDAIRRTSRSAGAVTHRVLVTGATGFVGRGLLDRLAMGPFDVSVAARDPNRVPRTARNVVRVDDIGPDVKLGNAFDGCDAVVHLAARVHVMGDTSADPLSDYRRVNVDGTLALARQAAAAGVRRF